MKLENLRNFLPELEYGSIKSNPQVSWSTLSIKKVQSFLYMRITFFLEKNNYFTNGVGLTRKVIV